MLRARPSPSVLMAAPGCIPPSPPSPLPQPAPGRGDGTAGAGWLWRSGTQRGRGAGGPNPHDIWAGQGHPVGSQLLSLPRSPELAPCRAVAGNKALLSQLRGGRAASGAWSAPPALGRGVPSGAGSRERIQQCCWDLAAQQLPSQALPRFNRNQTTVFGSNLAERMSGRGLLEGPGALCGASCGHLPAVQHGHSPICPGAGHQ